MKGCQKKVIFLKNTGSELFDEAYFIISKESEKEEVCEDSMILEANRIIADSIEYEKTQIGKKRFRRILGFSLPFLLGAALSTLIFFIFNA